MVTSLAEAVKPKHGGIFSAVMPYGGNFSAVRGFSFFGGNDFGGGGKTKYGDNFSTVIPYGGERFFVFWRQHERRLKTRQ